MTSIPDHLVEDIRERADIVEIVSEHTRLRRSGRTFRGPCPLHGGNGPNFSVDPRSGFFKCFVCGEGGTVYTFLQKQLGLSYPDAVRSVAERVGVDIPDAREEERAEDPNQPLYEANAFAADWFRRRLWEGDEGVGAREYLHRRGVSRELAERFGLGWAPEGWTALAESARAQGVAEEQLLELGILKRSAESGRVYDAFRGRLIFPIEDLGGRTIAFGGRVLGDELPKYLNSPESPVYHKGRTLYGLGRSRNAIRRAEVALVVEGYMDFLALAAHGVENAVAPLGTAMTAEQAALLARYTSRAILLYDSDRAGLRASFRSGDELLRAGVEPLVATLPEGEDPDSLVRGGGRAALKPFLDDAVDVLERKIQILERRDAFGSISGTRRAVDALLPTVRAATDEVLRGVYLARVAERTGVTRETLEREAAAAPSISRPVGNTRRRDGATPGGARPAVPPALGAERNLVLLMLQDDAWTEQVVREVGPAEFSDPAYRAIFEGLLRAEGERDPEGEWLRVFPPEVLPVVEELRGTAEGREMNAPAEVLDASIRSILARPLEERLVRIEEALPGAPPERQLALVQEMEEIRRAARERGLPLRAGVLRGAGRAGTA